MPRLSANDNRASIEELTIPDLTLLIGARIAEKPVDDRPMLVILARSLLEGVCKNALEQQR